MNASQRRNQILQSLAEQGQVLVEELVDKYQVSAVTIRYDLNLLAKKGLVIRSRGGAMAINTATSELSIEQKESSKTTVKKRLAKAACKLLKSGDSIILDSGTTTAEIANQLGQFESLIVMTNGLNVIDNLVKVAKDADHIQILTTGGTLRHKSLSFYGQQAELAIKNTHFDKVLLGVDGFDFNAGLTTHFEYEAQLNRVMCRTAKQVIVVTDSSKFNRCGVHKICNINQIDVLVTDDKIPESFVKALKRKGIELVIVASDLTTNDIATDEITADDSNTTRSSIAQ